MRRLSFVLLFVFVISVLGKVHIGKSNSTGFFGKSTQQKIADWGSEAFDRIKKAKEFYDNCKKYTDNAEKVQNVFEGLENARADGLHKRLKAINNLIKLAEEIPGFGDIGIDWAFKYFTTAIDAIVDGIEKIHAANRKTIRFSSDTIRRDQASNFPCDFDMYNALVNACNDLSPFGDMEYKSCVRDWITDRADAFGVVTGEKTPVVEGSAPWSYKRRHKQYALKINSWITKYWPLIRNVFYGRGSGGVPFHLEGCNAPHYRGRPYESYDQLEQALVHEDEE